MEFKGSVVLVVVGLAICCVQCLPAPRDSTVVKNQEVIRADSPAGVLTKQVASEVQTTVNSELPETEKQGSVHPWQVSCQYEEATEDLVCQEHCLPKGYSYGLCTGHKCSCV